MKKKNSRRAGRRPGSIKENKLYFAKKVYECIPEDGTLIQHKVLKKQCVIEGKMASQTMQNYLDLLQDEGLVIKEKMQAEKGDGKGYRRTMRTELLNPHSFVYPHDVESLSEIIKKDREALSKQNDPKQTKNGLSQLFFYFDIIIATILYPEFQEYSINPNKEQAKLRLTSVIKDIINPMLEQIADKAILPNMAGKYKEHTKRTFEMMFIKGRENIDESWIGAINTYCLKNE